MEFLRSTMNEVQPVQALQQLAGYVGITPQEIFAAGAKSTLKGGQILLGSLQQSRVVSAAQRQRGSAKPDRFAAPSAVRLRLHDSTLGQATLSIALGNRLAELFWLFNLGSWIFFFGSWILVLGSWFVLNEQSCLEAKTVSEPMREAKASARCLRFDSCAVQLRQTANLPNVGE
jgi:hypothetical protein